MTEEEKQELEALRREKHVRTQTERARAALTTAQVPDTFAPLLVGQDDEDTDRRTADFCAAYQKALGDGIRSHLPKSAPVLAPAAPQRPKRGVQVVR